MYDTLFVADVLVYASKVKKTNMFDWTQERTLAITDKAIYNIHKKQIKRCIEIKSLGGMTKTVPPSKCAIEFTVHVPSAYDYRFVSEKLSICRLLRLASQLLSI